MAGGEAKMIETIVIIFDCPLAPWFGLLVYNGWTHSHSLSHRSRDDTASYYSRSPSLLAILTCFSAAERWAGSDPAAAVPGVIMSPWCAAHGVESGEVPGSDEMSAVKMKVESDENE